MMRVTKINLLVGVLCVAPFADAQSDFDDYVASIRESGMAERAASDLRMMASILAGGAGFTATRLPDGSVGQSYGPPPGGRDLRERRATASNMESWTAFLRQHADTDQSGFVTTKEGSALRRLVEMGLVADQLKTHSLEELERAQPLSSSEADLAAYAALRAGALKQGLEGLPALPRGVAPIR
jgi:hypothetical protein